MPCFISYRHVTYVPSDKGVRIIVWTDVPSHVWVRLTPKEPWVHKKPVLRRGQPLVDDVRFCFTVYEDNEQKETGDTLIHTFWKEAWPVCTTKWFYFWGSIAGETCVSTSPIFEYHNTGIAPVPSPEVLRTFTSIEANLITAGTPNTWQLIDCSKMVSPDATGVLLDCRNLAPATWLYWWARKPGSTGDFATSARPGDRFRILVGLDENKCFEFKTTINDLLMVYLRGYFNDNITWLDSCPNRPPAHDATWHEVDWSDVAPTAQAGIFLVGSRVSAGYGFGVRPYGGTDNIYQWGFGQHAIVKLDNGRMEAKIDSLAGPGNFALVLVGLVNSNGYFPVNSTELTTVAIGSWEEEILPAWFANPTLACLEFMAATGAPWHGEKKWQSFFGWAFPTLRHSFMYVHPDTQRRIELWKDGISVKWYLTGMLD